LVIKNRDELEDGCGRNQKVVMGKYISERKEKFAFWLGILALSPLTCHDQKYSTLHISSLRSNYQILRSIIFIR